MTDLLTTQLTTHNTTHLLATHNTTRIEPRSFAVLR